MAEGPRSLTDALVDWISLRLVLSQTSDAPLPRWPPTPECRGLLDAGRVEDAARLPDATDARYLIVGHLRRDAPHVLLAQDLVMGRDVAIKLVRAPNQVARLAAAREARRTAALNHPGIVTVYEIDADGAYLVLELLDMDMRDLEGVSQRLALDAYCEAGRALAFAHARGVYHLDFKPENVLVRVDTDEHGRLTKIWPKVADFGGTHVPGPQWDLGDDLGLPRAGQRAGGALEDQRAFASVVWEAMTGGRQPPDGSELLAPELHAVLSRALMAEPSQRWADMTALVDAIERARDSTAVASTLIELAIMQAEDGMFSVAAWNWGQAKRALAGRHAQLGEGGVALGASLLQAAAEQNAIARRRRGYQRGLEVLEDALVALEAAGERELACDAAELAATACERLLELRSSSSDPQRLERRAASLRARYLELTMPTDNTKEKTSP